jgi:hypothetical protein
MVQFKVIEFDTLSVAVCVIATLLLAVVNLVTALLGAVLVEFKVELELPTLVATIA